MLNRKLWGRLKPYVLFIACYTAGFVLFACTLRFTFPFVAGFLLALLLQPGVRFLRQRLHVTSGPAAAAATFAIYLLLFGLVFLLGLWLVSEISNLIRAIAEMDIGRLTEPLNQLIAQAGEFASRIDQNFIQENQKQIINFAQTGASILTGVLTAVLGVLTSLPTVLAMFLVMVVSTYFFSKDMVKIKAAAIQAFSPRMVTHLRDASRHGLSMGGRYFASYLLLYFITFLETLVVFASVGVPYPLVLSMIAGFADILPVLGPGAVYLPVTLAYLANGNPLRAISLLVCWLLITAIRQVLEPKLVSATTHIHPLTMLAALYFALVANSFVLLIYFTSLLLMLQVLKQAGILRPVFYCERPLASPAERKIWQKVH